ncbi:hypothetical protein CHISP_2929 [Chitinispirillum alkaliphilum]|nr:hypothetical protein CHISP_2929 [Chitinispirillum alkaliphilum]
MVVTYALIVTGYQLWRRKKKKKSAKNQKIMPSMMIPENSTK